MVYRILADVLTVVHLAFVVFALLGGLAVLRWRWVVWLHLPAAFWAALVEFTGWICPLTPLEKWLRTRAGAAEYAGGFVEHYLLRALYPSGLTRGVQTALGIIVIVVNLVVYGYVWHTRHVSARETPDVANEHHAAADR